MNINFETAISTRRKKIDTKNLITEFYSLAFILFHSSDFSKSLTATLISSDRFG